MNWKLFVACCEMNPAGQRGEKSFGELWSLLTPTLHVHIWGVVKCC